MNDFYKSKLKLVDQNPDFYVNQLRHLKIGIKKLSNSLWPTSGEERINIAYHWRSINDEIIIWDGIRTALPDLKAEEEAIIDVAIKAPEQIANYILEITLVHENVTWIKPEDCESIFINLSVQELADENIFFQQINYYKELELINKNYHSWEEFLCWSTLNRKVFSPFKHLDQSILRFLIGSTERINNQINFGSTLCSVCMIIDSTEAKVKIAIDSVLKQTHPNLELIIVSNLKSIEKLRDFDDSRIKFITCDDNNNEAQQLNLALTNACGEYVAYINANSYWNNNFLKLMLEKVKSSTRAKSAYCAHFSTEKILGQQFEYFAFGPFNRSLLENTNYIELTTFIHHIELYQRFSGFNQNLTNPISDLILRYTESTFPIAVPALLVHSIKDINTLDFFNTNKEILDANSFSTSDIKPNDGIDFHIDTRFTNLKIVHKHELRQNVSIVIPSFEAPTYLEYTLAALIKFTPNKTYEVIIVDNNSTDEVQKILDTYEDKSNFKIIRNSSNLGFTAAVNIGINNSNPNNDIVLLNNDTIVTENWLEELQRIANLKHEYGIIVPRQVLPAGTATTKNHVAYANLDFECDVNLSSHHHNIVNPNLNPELGLIELSFAAFFCVYIKRECINKTSELDQKNGKHYFSDRIYCENARNSDGFITVYTPHSKVYHFLQKATKDYIKSEGKFPDDSINFSQHPMACCNQNALKNPDPKNTFVAPNNLRKLSEDEVEVINSFSKLYYDIWEGGSNSGRQTINTWWLGHLALKSPNDLWIYQEIITETKPDLIIECGTNRGGSALYLATICELLGKGKIISIDIAESFDRPIHERIEYIQGSSTDSSIVSRIKKIANNYSRIMVILDSDHSRDHVLKELCAYADLVSQGCYLIVEDTNINGHPACPEFGPGPMEAVQEFLKINSDFEIDRDRERFLLTLNPYGYLKKNQRARKITEPQEPSAINLNDLGKLSCALLNLDGLDHEEGTEYPDSESLAINSNQKIELRNEGRDWPGTALTMVGTKRLLQFQNAIESVIKDKVPGDILEAGVWRGGASILARAVLKAYGIKDRNIWLADSFEGLPKPDSINFPEDSADTHHLNTRLLVNLEQVQNNFKKFNLLDDQVKFLPGWFSNTLNFSNIKQIAVLRLDGDMYESTIQGLEALYPKVSAGGYIIIDDYGAVAGCKKAVDDYRRKNNITAPMIHIDWTGTYWQKINKFTQSELETIKNLSQYQDDDSAHDIWDGSIKQEVAAVFESAKQKYSEKDYDSAKCNLELVLESDPNHMQSHELLAKIKFPDINYIEVLNKIHAEINTQTYLEIGVFRGNSLKSATNAKKIIGIDPRPLINYELQSNIDLYCMTSNNFFSQGHAVSAIPNSFDFAFIDGSHHFEQVLIDFINLERFSQKNSIIALHDTLPLNAETAASKRSTTFYTGDVWKLIILLLDLRNDLKIETIPCYPSGLTLISNLDSKSKEIWDSILEKIEYYRSLDFDYFTKRIADFNINSKYKYQY